MIAALILIVQASRPVQAAPSLELLTDGLANPVYVTHSGDRSGRLFIVEQGGRVKVLRPATTTPTDFLVITAKVLSGGERGLLGLAFHPGYATNRRFFVNYTRQPDGATVIAEFEASVHDPDVAAPGEKILLTIPQPYANHNGGMLAFGPDGYLYIGMGDGGSANDPENRAQNINELLGKILRIDVDRPDGSRPYSSPADNPFFGATPGRDEIYAVGFRNPWRFSFDRVTGQLFAGDVGQGAFEEIDVVTRGGNYGWRVFEGTRCTGLDPARCSEGIFTPPVFQYAHESGRCSITGGYVYRGARGTLPRGTYVFGDFCSGEIFTLAGGGFNVLMKSGHLIASFGEDEDGELYIVSLAGTVYRLIGEGGAPAIARVFACGSGSTSTTIGVSGTARVTKFESPAGIEHVLPEARSGYQVCYTVLGVGAFSAFDVGTAGAGFGEPTVSEPNGAGKFPVVVTRDTIDGRLRITREFRGNTFTGPTPNAGFPFDQDADATGCGTLQECGNCANRTLHVLTRITNLSGNTITAILFQEIIDLAIGNSNLDNIFFRTNDAVVGVNVPGDSVTSRSGLLLQSLILPVLTDVFPVGQTPSCSSSRGVATPTEPGDFEARVLFSIDALSPGTNTGNSLRLHYRRF